MCFLVEVLDRISAQDDADFNKFSSVPWPSSRAEVFLMRNLDSQLCLGGLVASGRAVLMLPQLHVRVVQGISAPSRCHHTLSEILTPAEPQPQTLGQEEPAAEVASEVLLDAYQGTLSKGITIRPEPSHS